MHIAIVCKGKHGEVKLKGLSEAICGGLSFGWSLEGKGHGPSYADTHAVASVTYVLSAGSNDEVTLMGHDRKHFVVVHFCMGPPV